MNLLREILEKNIVTDCECYECQGELKEKLDDVELMIKTWAESERQALEIKLAESELKRDLLVGALRKLIDEIIQEKGEQEKQ